MVKYVSVDDLRAATTKRNKIWNTITDASGRGLDEIIDSLPSADVQLHQLTEEDVREWCYKRCLTVIDNALYLEMGSRWSASTDVQPEIIRCKDCKHRDADDFCTGRGYPNVLVPDDGFCDKGERRENVI